MVCSGAAPIVISCRELTAVPAASVTLTQNASWLLPVAVPRISPDCVPSASPRGSVPDSIDHWNGASPPPVSSAPAYSPPPQPLASVAGEITVSGTTRADGLTRIVYLCAAPFGGFALSCTVTTGVNTPSA